MGYFLAYLSPSADLTNWSKFDINLLEISGSVTIDNNGLTYTDKKNNEKKVIPLHSILQIEERFSKTESSLRLRQGSHWKEAVVYYHKQEIEFSTNYVVRVNSPGKKPYGFNCYLSKNNAPHYLEVYTLNGSARIIIPYWLVKGIVYKGEGRDE